MKPMTKNNQRLVIAAAVACLICSAMPAYAGPLTGAVTYFKNNIAVDIETLGIIAVAIIMFSMQIRWPFVLGVCAGVWCLANTETIRGIFSGFGG